jgi:hypothetical protein
MRRRSNDPIVSHADPSTKSPKQGGKAMPSSRAIAANGIEIFLREQGEGPLALLCHGWPEHGLDCFPQSECGLAVLSGAAQ